MLLNKNEISLLRECVKLRKVGLPFFFIWDENVNEESDLYAFNGTESGAMEMYSNFLSINFAESENNAPTFTEWCLEFHKEKQILHLS